ncbi:MAG: RecX family transcriptional regulator [Clostridia bacterium]|jgi:SOS response regulatory protein OraA/RecX|nr:RecX family transcriptional regulator [Clostridia bacterium]
MLVLEKLLRDEERKEATAYCGGNRFRITLYDCNRLELEQGMDVSDELLEQLEQADARLSCIQKGFTHLSYGDLSKKKLYEKLRRHYEPALCRETVDLFEERGYLNDLALAERYADNYYSLRSYGPMRIKQELYGKGFTPEVIDTVLEPYRSMDHREKVTELLQQKFRGASFDDPAVKKKASAWLNRQGYGWSDISDVFNDYQ